MSQPNWHANMSNELTTLMQHATWDLVPSDPNCNPMTCKFRMDQLKVCLIPKGYHQHPSLDYKDTFNLVVKSTTI